MYLCSLAYSVYVFYHTGWDFDLTKAGVNSTATIEKLFYDWVEVVQKEGVEWRYLEQQR